MKNYFLIYLLFFVYVHDSSATLVDGIATLSWTPSGSSPIVDRFLTDNTQIQLKILCREPNTNGTEKTLNAENRKTKIQISGRIGHIVGCLPLQSDTFMTTNQLTSKENKESPSVLGSYYQDLWKQMEQRPFTMQTVTCDYQGELTVEEYKKLIPPEISPAQAAELRKNMIAQEQMNKNKKTRRADEKSDNKQTPLASALSKQSDKTLRTWADGYYLIELSPPSFMDPNAAYLDVDVIVTMKNRHGGYITADEYPALVFYGVMCGIYGLFIILWVIWCGFYWRELLKIQFWIGGVIIIGMIEKSAFLAEYDTVNRNGYKVHFAIVTAEVLSCLKRTVSRMLVIIVALGYGIVKPRLGPLKQKVFAMGLLYFGIATTEAILRINTKNDETNNKILISRIPLAVIDATIYYWIFTGLVTTTRTLRLRKNIVKLNVYRHFTNTLIFAIVASLLFMVWSLKSHFFTTCITNWREFWVNFFSFYLKRRMFFF
jgi:hypothetical protein